MNEFVGYNNIQENKIKMSEKNFTSNEKRDTLSDDCRQYIDGTMIIMDGFIPSKIEAKSDDDSKKQLVRLFLSDVVISRLNKIEKDNRNSYIENPEGPVAIIKEVVSGMDISEAEKTEIYEKLNPVSPQDIREMLPFFSKFDLLYPDGPGDQIRQYNREVFAKNPEALKASTYLKMLGLRIQ